MSIHEMGIKELNKRKLHCERCKILITDKNYGAGMEADKKHPAIFLCNKCFTRSKEIQDLFLEMGGNDPATLKCYSCKKPIISEGRFYKEHYYCLECDKRVDN